MARKIIAKISRTSIRTTWVCVILLQWNGIAADKDGGFISYPGALGAAGPVLFSHKTHGLRGAGYACEKCHAPAKAPNVTMDEIRQGHACGSCHDGTTQGPRSQKPAAPIQTCSACHMPDADIVITLNRMDSVAFPHTRHITVDPGKKASNTAGFSCSDCHPAPFGRESRGPAAMEVPHKSGGCAQCHNGKRRADGMPVAFAATSRCLTCHRPAATPAAEFRKQISSGKAGGYFS